MAWTHLTAPVPPTLSLDTVLSLPRCADTDTTAVWLVAPNHTNVLRQMNCVGFADDNRLHHHANFGPTVVGGCARCREIVLKELAPMLKTVPDHAWPPGTAYLLKIERHRTGRPEPPTWKLGALVLVHAVDRAGRPKPPTWRLTGAPAGMALAADGKLSWPRPVVGEFHLVVSVSNVHGRDEVRWKLTIAAGQPARAPVQSVRADGGDGPSAWSHYWSLATKAQHEAAAKVAQKSHREHPLLVPGAAGPTSTILRDPAIVLGQFRDLKYLQEGMGWWTRVHHGIGPRMHLLTAAAGAAVTQVVQALRTASDNGNRKINAVAFACHGEPFELIVGPNGIRLRDVSALLDQTQDFLADDVRFVLYACSGGGKNPTGFRAAGGSTTTQYPGQAAGQAPGLDSIAYALCKGLLERGKTGAEVWGHVDSGNAFERSQLRRFRARDCTVLTLFDFCFPPGYVEQAFRRERAAAGARAPAPPTAAHLSTRLKVAYENFSNILISAIQTARVKAKLSRDDVKGADGVISPLPMWPVDLETTDLPTRCQAVEARIWAAKHPVRH